MREGEELHKGDWFSSLRPPVPLESNHGPGLALRQKSPYSHFTKGTFSLSLSPFPGPLSVFGDRLISCGVEPRPPSYRGHTNREDPGTSVPSPGALRSRISGPFLSPHLRLVPRYKPKSPGLGSLPRPLPKELLRPTRPWSLYRVHWNTPTPTVCRPSGVGTRFFTHVEHDLKSGTRLDHTTVCTPRRGVWDETKRRGLQ